MFYFFQTNPHPKFFSVVVERSFVQQVKMFTRFCNQLPFLQVFLSGRLPRIDVSFQLKSIGLFGLFLEGFPFSLVLKKSIEYSTSGRTAFPRAPMSPPQKMHFP